MSLTGPSGETGSNSACSVRVACGTTAPAECRSAAPRTVDATPKSRCREIRTEVCPCGRLTDVLKILAGLEADRASRRDAHFLTGPRVAADAALPRLHLEHPEAPELNPVAALHRHAHRIEYRVNGYLGLDLGNVCDLRNLVDDVHLDHLLGAPG